MPASSPQLDALIIGAGWSGLTSALQMSKAGKKVLCLEARKRVGGRAFTHSWNEDTPMDNNDRTLPENVQGHTYDFGCSYIHGYEEGNPVKEIAKRYGVNVFVSKPTAMQIIGKEGALPSKINDKMGANLGAAQAAAKAFAKERRQSSSTTSSNKQQSLSSFLFNEIESPLFSNLSTDQEKKQAIDLARMLHIPLGTEIENISLNHFGYEENFAGTDGIPEGGFTRLITEMTKEIQSYGGEIQLGKVVKKITNLGQGKGVQVDIADEGSGNQTIQAKTAIVTIPLAVLKSSLDLFEPSLDSQQQDAIKRTTVGNLNKVLLTYKEPWWSLDVGTFVILPTATTNDSESSSLSEIFSSTTLIVNSLCASNTGLPPSLTSPSLLVMVGASAAKKVEQFSRLQVAQALDDYLSPRLTLSKEHKSQLKHTFYSRWAKQEFTRGATTTPITVGNSPSDLITLATPLWNDSLYFAGEHCEVNHRGSVAGAVVSAQTTSDKVLKYLASNEAPVARH